MDSREAEMKWMVKGELSHLSDLKLRTFDDYGYSRSFKFGHVPCALDLRTYFHIHYIVLHLCDARQPAYHRCGVHGAFRINIPSFHMSQLCPTFSNRP